MVMSVTDARRRAIAETLELVRPALADGPSEEALATARGHMLKLAEQTELFPRSDFPLRREILRKLLLVSFVGGLVLAGALAVVDKT